MDSELLHSKERLALERKASPQGKLSTAENAGAAWTHMRQRLCRAEREARVARRLTVGMFCMSLAGIAGAMAVARPWSAVAGSAHSAGPAGAQLGTAAGPILARAEPLPVLKQTATGLAPGAALSRMKANAVSQGPPPARPGASKRTDALHQVPALQKLASRSPGRTKAVALPASRSAGRPRSKPVAGARGARGGSESGRRAGQGWRVSSVRYARGTPSGGAGWRSRWRSHDAGRASRWRILRVSRRGAATLCLVDPRGHWWVARPARLRSFRRGDERQ